MNILFIMTDQQRIDYLSIYGNKILKTPAMDRIGNEGTVFKNTFVQSAVCGPSRACFYTGRYVHTNRSHYNEVPLPITEKTMGHYFEEAGYRGAVIGKTHMYADYPLPDFVDESYKKSSRRNLSRIDSVGFEYITGASGTPAVPNYKFIDYLKSKGYEGEGQKLARRNMIPEECLNNYSYEYLRSVSGSYDDPSRMPTSLKREDSSVHYLTDCAIDFMKETTDRPWFLHLSYYRPHHPNHAPEPYNTMFDEKDFPSPVRSESELNHPIFEPFMSERNVGKGGDVKSEEHCRHYRAVYAGLVKEIDDNLNRLFDYMEKTGLMDNTMIIFTSDHGDLLGDHWLFEKEMCYWQSHQVPLLIRHPEMNPGVTINHFTESVDILPTCLDAAGIEIAPGIQGKSLMPFLSGEIPEKWRNEVFAEWTFEYYKTREDLGLTPEKSRAIMIRNRDYSYCFFNGLPDMLFDLKEDPNELNNLADNPAYKDVVSELKTKMLSWLLETWDEKPLKINIEMSTHAKTKGPSPDDLPYNFGRFNA